MAGENINDSSGESESKSDEENESQDVRRKLEDVQVANEVERPPRELDENGNTDSNKQAVQSSATQRKTASMT